MADFEQYVDLEEDNELEPPLPFVLSNKNDVSEIEAVNKIRSQYHQYRQGHCAGVKGELVKAVSNLTNDLRSEIRKMGSHTELLVAAEERVKAAEKRAAAAEKRAKEAEAKIRAMTGAHGGDSTFATADADLVPPQVVARQQLRTVATDRKAKRTDRVTEARKGVSEKSGKGQIEGSFYSFTTGKPVKTDVVVARGVVANPAAAGFEIIPMSSASSPLFVFTDDTVNGLYGDKFVAGFETMGYKVNKIVIPDGEDAKTLEVYAKLADQVLSMGIDKHSVLISLGGGAVANVCGFIASTLHRGIGLIHFPTTLLAQCDASISHKQAVNAPHGKNLVGSYYAPIRIVVDPDVLQTLEEWLLPDGMGEVVKHALCQDAGPGSLLERLETYDGALDDPDFLEDVVRRTIQLKCEVIDIDPKEHREATVLIYGHTACHPIEALSHRPGSMCCLSHGQAVAIGCIVEARVGVLLGTCDQEFVDRSIRLCQKYALPTTIPTDISVSDIMAKMPFNKTWTAEGSLMTLPERAGKLFNVDSEFLLPVPDNVIAQAMSITIAAPGTLMRGAGSSGDLRKSRSQKMLKAAESGVPGAGWSKNVDGKIDEDCC